MFDFAEGFICNTGICEGILDVVMPLDIVVEERQLGDLVPRKIFIVSTSLEYEIGRASCRERV